MATDLAEFGDPGLAAGAPAWDEAAAAPLFFRLSASPAGDAVFLYASPEFRRRFLDGCSGGASFTERFSAKARSEDRARLVGSLRQAAQEKAPWRCRFHLSGKFPQSDPVVIAAEPEAETPGGVIYVGCLTFPIAEAPQTRAEGGARVDAVEERLRAAEDFAASASDWFWETDAEGRFTFMSDSFRDSLGEDPEQYYGRTRAEIVLRYEDPAYAEEVQAQIARREPFRDLQFQRLNGKGHPVWVRTSGVPVFDRVGAFCGYRGAGSDITEYVETIARRNQMATLLDQAPIGLIILDDDLRIEFTNAEFARTMGRSLPEMPPGMRYADVLRGAIERGISADDTDFDEGWIRSRLADLQAGPTLTERFYNDRWIELRTAPLPSGQVVILCVDVDERRRLQEQLVHAQRLEAMGRLTAGVAHDFNNLLAVVMGNLELLELDLADPVASEMISAAIDATRRGATLTQQLLSFGRRATLSPKVLDVNAVIGRMDGLFRRALPATIVVRDDLAADLAPARLDQPRFETALLNLIINARDAMPDGGSIAIETRNCAIGPAEGGEQDFAAPPGDYVAITVTDTGFGMTRDVAAQAFEPFFTTKDVGEGSGLGLSMIIGFARQSGGDAAIEATPGRGASITMYFPASTEQLDAATPVEAKAATRAEADVFVLVVEDSADVLATVARQLARLGYGVLEAASGAEAAEILRTDRRVDLLLSDVVLADDMQGPAVARMAKELRPGIRTIFMSGYPRDVLEASHDVIRDAAILLKPTSIDKLDKAIRDALA